MTRPQAARKALRIPDPIVTFDITPEVGSGFVFKVLIFRTLPAMRRYLEFTRPDKRLRDAWGFMDERTCTVNLSLYTCTDNCVSHELLHAVFWWANCKRLSPESCLRWNHRNHERLAEALGNMISQFWRKFIASGHQRKQCWGYPSEVK